MAFNKYGAYCVPVAALHRPAARRILSGEVWEAPTLEFVAANCKGGDIIHAGTFFGDFLPALSMAADRGATIWAFEPNPESFRCASITLRLNQLGNVELANAGLGASQGTGTLVVRSDDGVALGGRSHITAHEREVPRATESLSVLVQILTIDDTLPQGRHVSVIQLDVEGYEKAALAGAMRTIRRDRPLLILETVPDDAWLSESLWPLGYRVEGAVAGNAVLRSR